MSKTITQDDLNKVINTDVKNMIDTAVSDLSEVMSTFATQIDHRFNEVDNKLNDIDAGYLRRTNTIDAFFK